MKLDHLPHLTAAVLMMTLTACSQSRPVDTVASTRSSHTAFPVTAKAEVPVRQFVARGNEPFWTIKVNGNTLIWITPENSEGKQLAAEQVVYAKGIKFTGKDGDKAFTLDIVEAPCADTMAEQEFEFTATWDHAGESHSGCADRVN